MSSTSQAENKLQYRTKWDEAIADARRKIKSLNRTIAIFKERKRAGEIWPGDSRQSINNETKTSQI
ncbi:MAG TPA: hypothetical protein VMB47_15950 [Candidatus Aquilonibacter sp.]|nr:hypothetical protein [Candidatus Aquilonibacter sp.]